jgi:hypothetical protein
VEEGQGKEIFMREKLNVRGNCGNKAKPPLFKEGGFLRYLDMFQGVPTWH